MGYQKPKGTQDLLPGVTEKWQYVEEKAREVFKRYQFQEIRTPMFEHYEVISRSVGDTTDIVSKEMYDFYDKGDRHVTLRPEGTAPVVRAFVEHKLFGNDYPKPYKTYYIGSMFRYERPQAGRLREFHQIGVETFGGFNPALDVENIAMAMDYFTELGLSNLKLVINSLGDQESRLAYRQALIDYLEPFTEQLSKDSKRRLHENPLRVLDSKEECDRKIVQNAPSILDYLNAESKSYFEQVLQLLDDLQINYTVDHTMVRGLDYYNHTIFEIMSDAKTFGAITTICAGGRYMGLVEELGGPATPGFGFALGIERILLSLEAEEIQLPIDNNLDVYVVGIGEEVNSECLKLVQAARRVGLNANRDYLARKPKAQFKTANKQHAKIVITIGENELTEGIANVKNMASGFERTYALADIYNDFTQIYQTMLEENE